MVTRKDWAVAALEAIEDIQQRIDRVAKDVETGKRRFAAIDTWTLAYLLGLDLGSQGVCGMQPGCRSHGANFRPVSTGRDTRTSMTPFSSA